MAKIAFLGLGRMGLPMAIRLVDAGHDVTVWNRTAEKARPAVQKGARRAASPADAAGGAEAVCTMLATPAALDEVLFGPEGAAAAMPSGATLLEMSTVGPHAVAEVRTRLPEGAGMLDAPVLGSVPEATEGSLKVFAGGDAETYERWRPVLGTFGSPRLLGPVGSGAAMKLVVNSTLMVLMAGLGEALALGDGFGLEQGAMLDILSDSAIGVTARGKRSRIERGAYPPNFTLELARKDAELVVEEARRAGVEMPVAIGASGWMTEADEAGFGGLDYSAVIARIRGLPASGPKGT